MLFLLRLAVPVSIGILAVTVIDIAGSIASRKFNFSYAKLAFVSYVVYTLIGFSIGLKLDLISTLCGTFLVGLYDATIGLSLSKKYNANWGEFADAAKKTSTNDALVVMFITSLVFGSIGFFLAYGFK
jgi:hypothetical protein